MNEYEKLTNQPLVVALAEFRFSSVLQMESYISSFQDYLRQDFPHFSTTQQQEMVIEQQGIRVNSSTGWVFLSSNKKRAIILDSNRIVILSSEYNRFPGFWDDCKKALDFLKKEVKPTLLLRIGLRYSDLIIEKDKNEPIESYVQSVVCDAGHFSEIGEQVHRINETVFKTDAGIIVIRSLYGKLNLPVWHDLVESPVTINKYPEYSNRILLDFDHYWQPEGDAQPFDVEFISNKINALHLQSRKAFWEITTDSGREVWK
ncbi:TIGR04255 family protein [Acinetobacter sp. ANC 4193]